ncbi:MAG TPA: hypothetical protein VHC46_01420 [Thermodesulfobacteriota bacterium]|nr:hypothetical protein [Thermodesulfobacteriota bacterium]
MSHPGIKALLFAVSILAASLPGYSACGAQTADGRGLDVITPSRAIRGEIEERIDRMGGDGRYDDVMATAESRDVVALLDPVSLGELYGTRGNAPEDNFEAPLRPADKDDLSLTGDERAQDMGYQAGGRVASLSEAGFDVRSGAEAAGEGYDGEIGSRDYGSGGLPPGPERQPVSSYFGELFAGDSPEGDSGAEDMRHAGDSPFSTHTLFEAVSISGTYPDSDVLELELPTLFRVGPSRITAGAGWLMPSGLEVPLGPETDRTLDESAYFLNVILRF